MPALSRSIHLSFIPPHPCGRVHVNTFAERLFLSLRLRTVVNAEQCFNDVGACLSIFQRRPSHRPCAPTFLDDEMLPDSS